MQYTIDRVPLKELNEEYFVQHYLTTEKPLIITGFLMDKAMSVQNVLRQFQKESRRKIGWYDASISDSNIPTPPLIEGILHREELSLRPLAMRIFMQPKGHQTLYHYDGNSLHGFNLQVKGAKEWYLISPKTPLDTLPLMFVSLVKRGFTPNEKKHDYYHFELQEGEMLFLPRYWTHSVRALQEENINYNWVATPMHPDPNSPLGKRESELLMLRKKFPFINRFLVDEYSEYGGKGKEIIENYIQGVSLYRVILRIFKELASLPKTLFLLKEIKAMAKDFETNNFNVNQ
jgi:hypothetical protein